jgi:Tfp pilus assembly protein PilF
MTLHPTAQAVRAVRLEPWIGATTGPARTLVAVLAAVTVIGCAARGPADAERVEALAAIASDFRQDLFEPEQPVPDAASLLRLTEVQQREFLRFFRSGAYGRQAPHRRIHAYMQRHLSDIRFDHETASAAEAISLRRGNCMSLALVTTALADAAGVDIDWQLAHTDPVYSSEGSVIYSANHIQSRLYEPRFAAPGRAFSFGRDYLLIDYFVQDLPQHGTPLERHEMLALVYQNLGAEAMAEDDLARAFWLLRRGLEHDPANPNLYNALGVVYRRAGDAETAERAFRLVLEEFGDRLIALRNYRKLLLDAGRQREADALERRMLKLPDPDPYPMIQLGDEALDTGDFTAAMAYYRKALKIAPYLHEIHLRMAQVHFERGDRARGRRELERGREQARAQSDRARYDRKLHALEQQR